MPNIIKAPQSWTDAQSGDYYQDQNGDWYAIRHRPVNPKDYWDWAPVSVDEVMAACGDAPASTIWVAADHYGDF